MKWYFIVIIILAIIITIFIFFIAPGNKKKVWDHNWLFESRIAHRGLHNKEIGIIENTESAFKNAIDNGFNIETDIALTKDLQIVVFHDDDFNRLCGLDKKVYELTLEEIQNLKLDGSSDKIMSFEEMLALINGQTGLLIEFKSQGKERNKILCTEAMKFLKEYKGNYVVQSFDPFLMEIFKDKYPMIPRGQLYLKFNLKDERKKEKGKGFKGFVSVFSKFLYNLKFTNCVSRPVFLDQQCENYNFICKFCRCFIKTIVWTVKDEATFKKLNNKVDNIIFENLDAEYVRKEKRK